ncbi:MAG: mechanosensitive ion channel [Bacteroidales bacterium]|nr:mechanosensitive ion channel [Bacteroidales bacterium]MCF8343454.1 mechanosensitive ion channel [Bacteroidales bacterium]MCF8375660.1 mechanosensitive ion channel [Bacteroidales bacterium]MCF8400757.1 mechanosensitive ion channel [Bacteroidales bacterium]
MTLKEIINYKIIDTKNIDVTVYHILIIIGILLAIWVFTYVFKRLIDRQIKNTRIEKGTGNSIFLIIKYLLWVFAIILILETIGVNLTLLIAGSAALLVGLGLGLQQIFRDIVSGVFMLFERNLKVGDVVELESDMIGRVEQIGLRTSKIRTRDNIITIVPNSYFIDDRVVNWSHMEQKTRFHVDVGVAYGSDVQLVEKVLLKVAKDNKDITHDPKAFVRFLDFGNSSLDFQLFFWTTSSFEVENIKSDLRFAIDRAFREHKITIPFPQRDLHIKSDFRASS